MFMKLFKKLIKKNIPPYVFLTFFNKPSSTKSQRMPHLLTCLHTIAIAGVQGTIILAGVQGSFEFICSILW